MVEKYKFNDEVTLEFDDMTTSTMLAVMRQTGEKFPKETMLQYYEIATYKTGEASSFDNYEAMIEKDFKEKGNEYVIAKMYLGCYYENMTDFATFPGNIIGSVMAETREIWDKYGLEYVL